MKKILYSLFDMEMWNEIIFTLTQQKLRSLMTMFGVFWGIFMLVVLVGCGFGMGNGVIGKLTDMTANSFIFITRPTTIPYSGLDADRIWKFKDADLVNLRNKAGRMFDFVAPINIDDFQEVTAGSMSGAYLVGGITPHYMKVLPQKVIYGRYINEVDLRESRKVCVIGMRIAKELFGDVNPCSQQISIKDVNYTIIGVTKQTNNMLDLGLSPTESVMMPISTEQSMMNRPNEYDLVTLAYKADFDIRDYQTDMINLIKESNHIHPDDEDAMIVFSCKDVFGGYQGIFVGITLLIWIVGIGTLMAGLIGITNIMLVTIKERTNEIGVRRALGAQPDVIIRQIMFESLTLTLSSGLAGIIVGVWSLSLLDHIMQGGGDMTLIERPMIPLIPTLAALLILVAGGLVAGYLPARRAMKIKAIEALREE